MVVPAKRLFSEKYLQGFGEASLFEIDEFVSKYGMFMLRSLAESDPNYKQIIPYIIFKHQQKLFLFKRLEKSGERRLQNMYSIGVGGHINPIDGNEKTENILTISLRRELREELHYTAKVNPRIIGYINDDANDVGRVHFGVVYLIEGSSPNVHARETDKIDGKLVDFNDLATYEPLMETWSKIVYGHLKKNLLIV